MEQSQGKIDVDDVFGEINDAIITHYLGGRGWTNFTLGLPERHAEILQSVANERESKRVRPVILKMLPAKKNKGFVIINLRGKTILNLRSLKLPVQVINKAFHPIIIADSRIPEYLNPLPTVSGIVRTDSEEIGKDLLELAEIKGIDPKGKTKDEILELIAA